MSCNHTAGNPANYINMEEVVLDLSGKNIVYIGGFGGIGLETCKQLVQKGVANLMILDQAWNESAFKELNVVDTKSICQFMAFDVTCGLEETRKAFAQIVEKFGNIDVLINGAGICDERDYKLIISINFTGTINATLVAYDIMDKSRGGRGGVVVNISSVAALTPFPVLPIYSATKGGILNFTRALAQLEPKTGITLYTICPGLTDTKHWENVHCFLGKDLQLRERACRNVQTQKTADCAMNIIKAIEAHANGATWMCDLGQLKLVEIKNFWTPPHKQNKDTEQKKESEQNEENNQTKETEHKVEETAQKEATVKEKKTETIGNQEKETGATLPLRKRKYRVADLGKDMQNMNTTIEY